MGLARFDVTVQDAQGRALAGAQVFWLLQPATVPSTPPPSPEATIYADIGGVTPLTQPVLSDGFGEAFAYMDDAILYTLAIYHPLFGVNPLVRPDQAIGGAGASSALTPFAGIPTGTIDGTNKVFTLVDGSTPLTVIPSQYTVWLNVPLIEGIGYTIALSGGVVKVTFSTAPQPASGPVAGDSLWAQGFSIS